MSKVYRTIQSKNNLNTYHKGKCQKYLLKLQFHQTHPPTEACLLVHRDPSGS